MQEKSVEWRKLLENIFSELKYLYKRCIKIIYTFLPNSPLLEHTAYKSAKYDCQGFPKPVCWYYLQVQSGKLLHQCMTKENDRCFYLELKTNCIKHVSTDKLNISNFLKKNLKLYLRTSLAIEIAYKSQRVGIYLVSPNWGLSG